MCIQTSKYMQREREQDKNIGMISVVKIHRHNTGKNPKPLLC